MKLIALLYALVAYAGFVGWFLYAICFLHDWYVPKTINSGEAGPVGAAIAVNLGLVLLFGLQHTVMARGGFKRWWTGVVPSHLERSTFVLVSAVLLSAILWLWQPMPATVWHFEQPAVAALMYGLSLLGAATVLYTTFLIDHWDLVGLRQVWAYCRGAAPAGPVFKERSLYRVMRHPMMLGILIWFWATPHMTQGHLLWAGAFTAYVLMGIHVEERGLAAELGEDYQEYRKRVPMLLPRLPRRG